MILRHNWAREEAHTPPRTAPATEACEGCDKTEQTQNTLFSNDSKGKPCWVYPGCDIAVLIKHIALIQEVL